MKAKDRILRSFHVQAHVGFAFGLTVQICEFLGVFLIRAWCFRLSILYQFGLPLYCRHLDVKIDLNICIGFWLYFYDRLLVFCGVLGYFVLFSGA